MSMTPILPGAPGAVRCLKPRLLILIVAYNAERTIVRRCWRACRINWRRNTTSRCSCWTDSSQDQTFEQSFAAQREGTLPFPIPRAVQPGESGLRRQPEDRVSLRAEVRLRLRRAGPWRRPVRAGMSPGSGAAAARRPCRRGVWIANARQGRRAPRRHAALQVCRQSHLERVSEPGVGRLAQRVPFRLPRLFGRRASRPCRSS